MHSSYQNWIQFYCHSLKTHSISIHPQCIKCLMSTGLLFWRAFCRPSNVVAETMAAMESANWRVLTWVCSHWLCGPLVCHWPLFGCQGCSKGVPNGNTFLCKSDVWFYPLSTSAKAQNNNLLVKCRGGCAPCPCGSYSPVAFYIVMKYYNASELLS